MANLPVAQCGDEHAGSDQLHITETCSWKFTLPADTQ